MKMSSIKAKWINVAQRFVLLFFVSLALTGWSQQEEYVIMYSSSGINYYMSVNTTANTLSATTVFNPNTCIWRVSGGNLSITIDEQNYTLGYTITGGNGKNKNPYLYAWGITGGSPATMTINNGGSISCQLTKQENPSHTYYVFYLCYNSGTFEVSETNPDHAVAYAVTKESDDGSTVFQGGLQSVNTSLTSLNYTQNANGTLTTTAREKVVTLPYTKSTFNSTDHYWYDNADHNAAPITHTPLTPTSYSWEIIGSGADYLTLANTTGTTNTIRYSTACPIDGVTGTIRVVAVYDEGDQIVKEKIVNINKYIADPTEILANDVRVAAEETETIIPTLVCDIPDYPNIYSSIHYVSNDPSIATVDNNGVVTGIVGGTTTITITADLQGGGSITKDVNVLVAPRAAKPTIVFDNTTGKLTMTSETEGAAIHYTINGSTPSENSITYNPANKPVLTTAATVRAIATYPGMNPSKVFELVVDQVATPTTTINDADETITFHCGTPGVTYYYTTDGSTPTFSSTSSATGIVNGVSSGSTVKVIAVKEGMVNSLVGSSTIMFTVKTPVIAIADDGTVTITCGTTGASIYYTLDNSEPTASSSAYSVPFPVSNGQIVKAIAIKTNYHNSGIATDRYMIESGANGSSVVLNDYEDHTWTYYAGTEIGNFNTTAAYKGKIYSPNPRNVKITYWGKGQMRTEGDASALVAVPEGMRVSVGLGDETENTFVYYKTLERNANDRYEYTTIPNPFQVRPTYAEDATTQWRGFQSWRIKSINNGAIYSTTTGGTALGVGDMLNAETAYYFVPTDVDGTGYTPNCTSMEIELEAVWARAYVNNATNVGVERNFNVLTADAESSLTATSTPTTYTSIYPNGTTDGNTLATGAIYEAPSRFTASSDTRFEYIKLYGNNTISSNCHNLIIGRGVEGQTSGALCASRIQGGQGNSMDFTVRVESGKYGEFYALRDNTNISEKTSSGVNKVRSVLGCDYDRAKEDNSKLNVTGAMWMGQAIYFSTQDNLTQGYYKCWIKSGDLQSSITVNGSSSNGGDENFYIGTSGNHSSSKYIYPRYLYMEGGQIAGIAGGMDDTTVTQPNDLRVYLKMTGGFVKGCVYGAGSYAVAAGVRNYVIVGGEVGGWIAAGCNGIGDQTQPGERDGHCKGDSYVYIGGNVKVGYKGWTINNVEGGNIFGAGRGASGKTYPVGTVNYSNLVIADNAMVEKNVYGGGNYGYTLRDAKIYIVGGTVDGKVFGGSNKVNGYDPFIYMADGLVKGGIYGGSNDVGAIFNDVTIQINGGQVGVDATHTGNIHGGGYGKATLVTGDVNITLGNSGALRDAKGVTVWGDVYGGSALGQTNANGTIANEQLTGVSYNSGTSTNVTMNAGVINGSIYGGGLGSNEVLSNVYGPVQVTINGGSINTTSQDGSGAVYGCNNISGAPQNTVKVDIYGTNSAPVEGQYALDAVYGGGNQANYAAGTPKVTIHNCDNSIEYIYGGGNAAHITNGNTDVTVYGGTIGNVFGGGNGQVSAANISGNTNVKIYGGTIVNVYGGSNTRGTIGGSLNVTVESTAEGTDPACPIIIDNVYGGGNKAPSAAGTLTLGCCERIDNVYGGANMANVTGNIVLNINDGNYGNIFGGNNTSGQIDGTITVNINKTTDCWNVDYVYGGGNKASYTAPAGTKNFPQVNIINGTVNHDVFGGGLGTTASVKGNPRVNMTGGQCENIYGGGSQAQVEGNPRVVVNITAEHSTDDVLQCVFGGGKGDENDTVHETGAVKGNPDVYVLGKARVGNNVFGGGNAALVKGDPHVHVGGSAPID